MLHPPRRIRISDFKFQISVKSAIELGGQTGFEPAMTAFTVRRFDGLATAHITNGDFGYGIAEWLFFKVQSAIPNPKSQIELVGTTRL